MPRVMHLFILLTVLSIPVRAAEIGDMYCYEPSYTNCQTEATNAKYNEYYACMQQPKPSTFLCQEGVSYSYCHSKYCDWVARNYYDQYISNCQALYCYEQMGSPLILGRPDLVGVEGGVEFDILGSGTAQRVGWTNGGSNGFLALDGDGDGAITNGKELFGNNTPQHQKAGEDRNGFVALRELDGNGDGRVDGTDQRFFDLLVWHDWSQDGISQPGEMSPAFLHLSAIDLTYSTNASRDRYGNRSRWRGKAYDLAGRPLALTDVIFASE